ncbi:MAG: response regulator transcription factor [Burkholderiales bacterium]|nr:response regulator transcription factor [Burkholderiales bacterium]
MIRLLICDDHLIVRQGLKQILADTPDIEVAAEASSGCEALRLARRGGIDVALLDIAMPDRDGLETLKRFRGELPRLPVLMLSTYPDRQYAVRCLKLGASGYLNKSADTDQLLEAVRKAANGGVFVTTAQAEALAASLGTRSDQQPHEFLSDREYQVLRLIATGRSIAQIATQLSLSPNTVSTYRARICEKTGTRNDVEIALYAVRQGLHQV